MERNPQEPYFIFEEEVLRAGTSVSLRYERARGCDGRVHLWRAAVKGVGRGGGAGGLEFDGLDEAKSEA